MSDKTRKLGVFPAFHKVAGRRVVIVGGGAEAAAKIRLLAETNAEIVVFAAALDHGTGADLIAAHGDWRGTFPSAADLAGAALVFAATGAEDSDRAVVALARAAGVPVNCVDRPELCDFYTPALVNRAPLAVAIGSEGVAPVLTRQVRARIEAMLAPRLGDLATLAEKLRGRVSPPRSLRSPTGGATGRASFPARSPRRSLPAAWPRPRIEALRALEIDPGASGHVSLVGAGPGAEDLLTLRAQRALQEADVIVHDRLVPDAIVAQGRRDARRIPVGKAKGAHSVSQDEINRLIVNEALAGRRVVRLKSGDPLIFGRAGEEIAALRAAGVSFDIVPGITAAFAAAAEAEIPLTLRDTSSALVFATGHTPTARRCPVGRAWRSAARPWRSIWAARSRHRSPRG